MTGDVDSMSPTDWESRWHAPPPYPDEMLSLSPVDESKHRANDGSCYDMGLYSFDDSDDKFQHYDSSPEGSTNSIGDEPDDDRSTVISSETDSSEPARRPAARPCLLSCSDRLDPFAALPVALHKSQEHLLAFHLHDYPRAIDGASPTLDTDPVATNFAIALTTPACFQVALARAAKHQLSLNRHCSLRQRRLLEAAIYQHRSEAISITRDLISGTIEAGQADAVIASIVSLGTFDQGLGSVASATLHFDAVRRVLTSIGGPAAIKSVLLSRIMAYLECVYGTSPQSMVWDGTDLARVLHDFNVTLSQVWSLWQHYMRLQKLNASSVGPGDRPLSTGVRRLHTFGPRDGTCLHRLLSTPVLDHVHVTTHDRMELVVQLNSLFIMCTVIRDLHNDPFSLQLYFDTLHTQVDQASKRDRPTGGLVWLMQANDQSESHSRRVWVSASYVWLLKHTTYGVQTQVKEWLSGFVNGKPLRKALQLNSFHFSYASC